MAAWRPIPLRECAPGLDGVERHVWPPSWEIRINGLVEHAAPGPRCSNVTAIVSGSVGCVATTGSHARSATDRGMGLTRRSNRTRGRRAVSGLDGGGGVVADGRHASSGTSAADGAAGGSARGLAVLPSAIERGSATDASPGEQAASEARTSKAAKRLRRRVTTPSPSRSPHRDRPPRIWRTSP